MSVLFINHASLNHSYNYAWDMPKHIEFCLVLSCFCMLRLFDEFQIYSGFSGSLCGSMSNFDELFLLEQVREYASTYTAQVLVQLS